MPRKKVNKEDLSPTQRDVKQIRPVFYEGPNKNADPAVARDIITMYVGLGLGYSAIRHIIGASDDKLIEDIIRQHMFGRRNVDPKKRELRCPGTYMLDEFCLGVVKHYVDKYNTGADVYNVEMLMTGKCGDDPVHAKKLKNCPKCNTIWGNGWIRCPFCDYNLTGPVQKKLF